MYARNSSEFLLALDSIQARNQVFFLWGGTIQKGDAPNKALGGGSFGCMRLNCAASLQLGDGALEFERVNVCHLGLSGGMLHRKIFNFRPSEMAGNAFKTNMVW